MICSLGSRSRRALTTVKPPMPESNTPIGCELPPSANGFVDGRIVLVSTANGNGRPIVTTNFRHRIAQRFGNGLRMWRQRFPGRSKGLTAHRAEVYRRIIVLNPLGDSSGDIFTKLRGGNALAFHGIAQKPAFDQDRRDFDISQNMKAGMLYAAIKHGSAR